MLKAEKRPEGRILSAFRKDDFLEMDTDLGRMRIIPLRADIFRVRLSPDPFRNDMGAGIMSLPAFRDWKWQMDEDNVVLSTEQTSLRISRKNSAVSYFDRNHRLLLQEKSRMMEAFMAPMPSVSGGADMLETIHTPDGDKQVIRSSGETRKLFHTRLNLSFQEKEALYGLGQSEEGRLDLRGSTRYLHQANRKISIPLLISSLGWGILLATDGAGIFHDDGFGSCLYTEADEEMDYYFLGGGSLDRVIDGYRYLSGKAALLPRWALGYIQSQERYETEDELLHVAEEYRRRHIGLDCVVLDWCSWPDQEWGQKTLDPARFFNMSGTLEKLHNLDVHFMISIWPNMSRDCSDWHAFADRDMLLPGSDVYNAFDDDARKLYWDQTEKGLFRHGVDAWWCDSCEPFTPEWAHAEKPDPASMYQEYVQISSRSIPMNLINAYALFHAQTIWDGQRAVCRDRRVVNLMRSAHTGQQRYGAILWSGDISASWTTLQQQLREGLNFCASGMPYWTLDIGAFFVRRGAAWFWDGEYELGMEDPAYRELFVRWFQLGAFLPVFRGHGTDIRRELWELDRNDAASFQAAVSVSRLRYLILPYLYSLMGHVWLNNDTMMRLLAFDFPTDPESVMTDDEYMLGHSLLVCPVLEPAVDGRCTRRIYLPAGVSWYDLFTGEMYTGGRYVTLNVPLGRIPVFVRAGSILPVCPDMESAADMDRDRIELCIFPGQDVSMEYYEDAGDGFGYELGGYTLTVLKWNDRAQTLSVCDPENEGFSVPNSWSPRIHVICPGAGLAELYRV